MPELSIVIPCYNEADSLDELVRTVKDARPAHIDAELVLVDNGSEDDTASVLQRLLSLPENSFARAVVVPTNQGYGHGIMSGVRAAEGSVIAWTHADFQTDPADVFGAYETYRFELESGEVIVKGRREGRRCLDKIFTAGMSWLASAMLGVRMRDINAQPKVFSRSLIGALDTAPTDFSLDVYLLYVTAREGLELREYPVVFGKRQYGKAKGGGTLKGKIKLTRHTLRFLHTLRRKVKEGVR